MTLIATKATGWPTGFGNLLNKELDSWWRTRRWLVHLLLWLAVIAGFILLSKFVGITGTFLLQSLVVPAIVTLVVCRLVWGLLPGLNHFAEAIGILALHQTFYIALTLMLGTFFQSRGRSAGWRSGSGWPATSYRTSCPPWVTTAMPWSLARSASQIALWRPVGLPLWIPAAISAVLIVLMLLAALWRFEREEF